MWANRNRQCWLMGPHHALTTPLKKHASHGQVSRKSEARRLEGPHMSLPFLWWDWPHSPLPAVAERCREEGKRKLTSSLRHSDRRNSSSKSLAHLRKQAGGKEIARTEEQEEQKHKPFQEQIMWKKGVCMSLAESGPVPIIFHLMRICHSARAFKDICFHVLP